MKIDEMIVRRVRVDRTRTPQEALDATGCVQDTDRRVVDEMPEALADEIDIVFFELDLSGYNGFISGDELEKEFESRGLKPADPISVAAVNEDDPSFADKNPHGTHWKDAEGNWCCIVFFHLFAREVHVYRGNYDGRIRWSLAGIKKK